MELPSSSNEAISVESVEESTDSLEVQADINALPCWTLEKSEIDKLFVIISETDAETLNKITFNDVSNAYSRFELRPLRPSYSVYSRQLPYRQLMFESTFNLTNPLRSEQSKAVLAKYPEPFRIQIVHKVVSFIDSYSWKMLSKQHDLTDSCVICMSSFELNDPMRKLRCFHKFHRKCIDEWLVESWICPVCRKDLMGINMTYTGLSVLYYYTDWGNEVRSDVATYALPSTGCATSTSFQNRDNDQI